MGKTSCTASKTFIVALVISGPMPSPGITAILYLAVGFQPLFTCSIKTSAFMISKMNSGSLLAWKLMFVVAFTIFPSAKFTDSSSPSLFFL